MSVPTPPVAARVVLPSGELRIDRVASVADVTPGDWDGLVANASFYVSSRWLLAQERWSSVEHEYLLAWLGSELVGALPLYVDVTARRGRYHPPSVFADLALAWRSAPIVIAGGIAGYEHDLLISDRLPASAQERVLGELLAVLDARVRDRSAAGAAFLHLRSDGVRLLARVRPDTVPLLLPPQAVLDLPAGGLDGYLAAFTGHRRRRIGAELRTFAGAGYTVDTARLGAHLDDVLALSSQVEGKYRGYTDQEPARRSFRRQVETLDAASVLFHCRAGGTDRLVGLALAYHWCNTLYLRSVGFDYAALRDACEYFNLVYYEPIRWAAEHGVRTLHLGVEAYDAKIRRGAALQPLWAVLTSTAPRLSEAEAGAWNSRSVESWYGGHCPDDPRTSGDRG